MDHQAEFKLLLVLEKFGKVAADAIDWSAPRLVCIAADFTKYDGHAVPGRSIATSRLIRYRRFGDELPAFGWPMPVTAAPTRSKLASGQARRREPSPQATKPVGPDKSYAEIAATLPEPRQLLASLEDRALTGR